MTAPPDRWQPSIQWFGHDHAQLIVLPTPNGDFVRYADHTAAIDAAEARGREQAAKYLMTAHDAFASASLLMKGEGARALLTQSADVCRMASAAILALLPAPPADGGDT